jgi:hypothetical protein
VVLGVAHEGTATPAQSSTAVEETVRAVPLRKLTTIRDAATTACAPGDCQPIRPTCANPSGG